MILSSNQIIEKTEKYVQDFFQREATGHDWWHTYRVRMIALKIAKEEGADPFIVEMAALLHDIGDYKFFAGDEKRGSDVVARYLHSLPLNSSLIKKIITITKDISFMKTLSQKDKNRTDKKSLEFKAVSDADKLDAMGAIGIARAFTYGGYYHRPIYDPRIPPNLNISREEYKNTEGPSINHFYEKLLKLKDLMYTAYGKKLAQGRHDFLKKYLYRFYQEWRGEK
ncbi:MAG: HD domain-containing protein [Atribacterota bacterium]|jgi:uncharacterized protein|nr:HD domain-containing protein [Atribacterota bacterium]MDD4896622.1 HD domain-containing protein [Atribacterota bacterium]MDD5637913.1 HD domain-containing protein [Atribacterota bacterium]